jgi:hypothetical protein
MHVPAALLLAFLGAGPSAADSGTQGAEVTARPAEQAPAPPCASTTGLEIGPRLAQWVEKRQAKCAELAPYKPGFLERQLLLFEKAERPPVTQLNLFGFYPRVQAIEHRSQAAAGARFWQPDIGRTRIDAHGSAFWSLGGFRFYDLQLGMMPHVGRDFPLFSNRSDDVFELPNVRRGDDSRHMLYASFAYRWAPKFDFFGIGGDSRREDQADYLLEDSLYEVVGGYRVLRRLTVGARAGFYHAAPGPGRDEDLPQVEDVFAPSELPGVGREPDFRRYGASLVWDSRERARNPHSGGVLALQWLHYGERGGDLAAFDRLAADARLYLTLGHEQRVLALRAYASRDDAKQGSRVPFYLLSHLGNSHTLRAYPSQRFRGEELLLLQAEYRWEAAPALELAAFVDSGAVAATRHDPLGRFHTDGGIGLRFKGHEALLARIDCAWGGEGFRFLFRFSPSF